MPLLPTPALPLPHDGRPLVLRIVEGNVIATSCFPPLARHFALYRCAPLFYMLMWGSHPCALICLVNWQNFLWDRLLELSNIDRQCLPSHGHPETTSPSPPKKFTPHLATCAGNGTHQKAHITRWAAKMRLKFASVKTRSSTCWVSRFERTSSIKYKINPGKIESLRFS